MMMLMMALLLGAQPDTPQDKPVSTPPPPTKKDDPDQRIRCHREQVTGTLAGSRKVCRTVAEWRTVTDSASVEAQKIVDQGLIKPTNGQ